MQKTYIVANWKANKTRKEVLSWVEEVGAYRLNKKSNLEIVVCGSFVHIDLLEKFLPESYKLGVQNLSPYSDGAYTGEVSARMLSGFVDYSLLGHSERREYFCETHQQVALKVVQALENKIVPIVAVDRENWRQQINQFDSKQKGRCIFMYEPPEAISRQVGSIGEGEAAKIEDVVEMIKEIKQHVAGSLVLYGGSVKSSNVADFLNEKTIDGVLVGSASLKASEWIKIIEKSQEIRG